MTDTTVPATLLDEPKPIVTSLCVICGDEGTKSIARMLRSVLVRPAGPMYDEIVIGWNGSDHAAFIKALVDVGCYRPTCEKISTSVVGETIRIAVHEIDVPIVVLRQWWQNNFAVARQQTFDVATGTWRGYLDCDDVIPDPDKPEDLKAIYDCLRDHGIDPGTAPPPDTAPTRPTEVGSHGSLASFVASLDPSINCVVWPYDYTIGGDGVSLERHPRFRLYRWADGWRWMPGEWYHEDVEPTGANVRRPMVNPAAVVRHYPTENVEARTARNRTILQAMVAEVEAGRRPQDPRLFYNLGTYAMQDGDFGAAVAHLTRAIDIADDAALLSTYRTLRASANLKLARYDDAALDAHALTSEWPNHRNGWDALTQIAHAQGRWAAVIRYHNIAAVLPPLSTIDRPVERESHQRVMVVNAYLGMQEFDKAIEFAQQAVEAAPSDALARESLKTAQERKASGSRLGAIIDLAASYAQEGDLTRAKAALRATPPGRQNDPRVVALAEHIKRLYASAPQRMDDAEPLPIFRAPSLWARHVGIAALQHGWTGVYITGRPHPDDLAALDEICPDVNWLVGTDDDADDADGEKCHAHVDVDTAHGAGGVEPGLAPQHIVVIPAPGVPDDPRVDSLSLGELEHEAANVAYSTVTAKLLASPRPASDPPRLIVHVDRDTIVTPGSIDAGAKIAIYAPHWLEPWGPDSLVDTGCGGSEEACIYLARALTDLGAQVTIYGPYGGVGGGYEVRDRIRWRHVDDFNFTGAYDAIIAHRAPWVLTDARSNGKPIWIWHHDHGYPEAETWKQVAPRSNNLFVSAWQRRVLAAAAGVDESTLRGSIIQNGIPAEEFDFGFAPLERNPKAVFYASQPQRGLHNLLRAWRYVVEAEPQAVLRVWYGWQTAEMLARSGQDATIEALQEIDELRPDAKNVQLEGRLPQSRLSPEMLRCGVWAYPCAGAFESEVSCIAGLRAAAAGCIPVFSAVGALPETQPCQDYAVGPDATAKQFAGAHRAMRFAPRTSTASGSPSVPPPATRGSVSPSACS